MSEQPEPSHKGSDPTEPNRLLHATEQAQAYIAESRPQQPKPGEGSRRLSYRSQFAQRFLQHNHLTA